MTSVAPENGYRQAALHLQRLHRADRAWLLARLAPAQRQRLRTLLAELSSLGLALPDEGDDANTACERDANLAHGFPYPVVQAVLERKLERCIDGLPVQQASAAFARMPAQARAILLRAGRWRWAPDLWRTLDAAAQQDLLERMRAACDAQPAIVAAVVARFAQAAQSPVAHCADTASTSSGRSAA